MAGKTGTTQEHKSAAFIGIVPQMSGAVITFDNSNAPKPLCDGAGAPFPCREGNIFGGKTPAETWFGTMVPLLADQPVLPLPPTDRRYLRGGAEQEVPDVIGESDDDARAILREAGWSSTTRRADRDEDDDEDEDDDDEERGQRHRGRADPLRHRAARRDDPARRRLTNLIFWICTGPLSAVRTSWSTCAGPVLVARAGQGGVARSRLTRRACFSTVEVVHGQVDLAVVLGGLDHRGVDLIMHRLHRRGVL